MAEKVSKTKRIFIGWIHVGISFRISDPFCITMNLHFLRFRVKHYHVKNDIKSLFFGQIYYTAYFALRGRGGAGVKHIITVPGTEFYQLKLRRGRPVKI